MGVVLDNYIADGYKRSGHHCMECGDWYRRAKIGVNTWSFVSASGEPLGHVFEKNAWKALEAFRALPEVDRKPTVADDPDPEKGLAHLRPPKGGLVARLYNTALERGGDGRLVRAGKVFTDCYAGSTGCVEPALTQIDMLWMTEAEARSLLPAEPVVGASIRIPDLLERRLIVHSVPCANPVGDRAELTVTVTAASAERVQLRLEGWSRQGKPFEETREAFEKSQEEKKRASNGQATRWLGFLEYDLGKKAFARFEVLGIGDCWGELSNRKYGVGAGKAPRKWPCGYAFDLAGESAADRITPPKWVQNAVYNGGLSKAYWGK